MAKRKVMIVFEENGENDGKGGIGFNVYLEGATKNGDLAKIPQDLWPTVDFWGVKMFSIVVHHLKLSGAFKGKVDKGAN